MMQEWFKKAKLGIFIHWGIYAVEGIQESWSMGRGSMSYTDYMRQLDGFTASKYDPERWAGLFKKAGAKYVVLTTKHHDGVALFDTKHTDLNVVKRTPAGSDLVAPYCEALRKNGLKVGLYFTNTDWSDTEHMSVLLDKTEQEVIDLRKTAVNYEKIWTELQRKEATDDYDCEPHLLEERKTAWKTFINRYRGEITELLTNYGAVDLLWFDVMLQREGFSWESKEVKQMINALQPQTVVNGRLGEYGDYLTPECFIPLRAIEEPWELCTKFNDSWGYRYDDKNYKSLPQLVRMFVECISKGGNMLISVGPTAEGEIPLEAEKAMLELGGWINKYEEAIYPTVKGIPLEYFHGCSTLTEDKKTLYLFLHDKPTEKIMLNGIKNEIIKITALATGRELDYAILGGAPWADMPGCIWIDVPENELDPVCTVLKLELDGEITLVDLDSDNKSVGEQM